MAEKTVQITAELPESLFNALIDLAKKRGVSANTVLQRAVETEKFFAEKEDEGSHVLIEERNKNIKRVIKKKK